jgi:hypothetical protein
MKQRFIVPEPCSADWNQMTKNEMGRHCNACSKTVVDFTAMTNEEIISYINEYSSQHVCGHFYKSQLEQGNRSNLQMWKEKASSWRLTWLSKAAVGVFSAMLFLSSCVQQISGQIAASDQQFRKTTDSSAIKDSTQKKGKVKMSNKDTSKPKKKMKTQLRGEAVLKDCVIDGGVIVEEVMGDFKPISDTTTQKQK